MARLPTAVDVEQAGLRVTRRVIDPDTGQQTREATSKAVSAIGELTGRIRTQQMETELSTLDMQASAELDKMIQRARVDDDWETAPDRYQAEATTKLQEMGQNLRGDAARRAWMARSMQHVTTFRSKAQSVSWSRGVDRAKSDLMTAAEQASMQASDLTVSEEVRALAVKNVASLIDSAEARGLLSPDEATDMEIRFTKGVKLQTAKATVEADPAAALAQIEAKAGPFAGLDPDDAEALRNRAQARQREAEQATRELYLGDAYTLLEGGGSISQIPSERKQWLVRNGMWDNLRNYQKSLAEGATASPPGGKYDELTLYAITEPERFAKMDLTAYGHLMSDKQRWNVKELQARIRDAAKDDAADPFRDDPTTKLGKKMMSNASIYADRLGEPLAGPRAALVSGMIMRQIAREPEAPDLRRQQEIIAEVLATAPTPKAKYGEIPGPERNRIIEQIRREKGKGPDWMPLQEEVQRRWRAEGATSKNGQ